MKTLTVTGPTPLGCSTPSDPPQAPPTSSCRSGRAVSAARTVCLWCERSLDLRDELAAVATEGLAPRTSGRHRGGTRQVCRPEGRACWPGSRRNKRPIPEACLNSARSYG